MYFTHNYLDLWDPMGRLNPYNSHEIVFHNRQKTPIFDRKIWSPFSGQFPPFRNTFSESLGVAQRGTAGVYLSLTLGDSSDIR